MLVDARILRRGSSRALDPSGALVLVRRLHREGRVERTDIGSTRARRLIDLAAMQNLVKLLASSLREQYPACAAKALLRPFETLAEDRDFWNHARDGLAVLAARDFSRVYRLQR